MLGVCALSAVLLSASGPAKAQQAPHEKTRLLLIMDCSHSMWERWQSNAKIKVTQQVLLAFLDSIARQQDVEVALRVFGHLNRDQIGTRLEVPFGGDNIYSLQSKIKTLVPQGGCTAAAALTDALSDFPATGAARNLILIITDGMSGMNPDGGGTLSDEICNVARQVQLSGVVVQTFVLSIGGNSSTDAACAGSLFPVPNEEGFAKSLYDIFTLSGKKARVVVSLLDEQGELFPTEHPVAFYDHRTGISRESTIYSVDYGGVPDTLLMDPLVVYDMTVFTQPPLQREAMRFGIDSVNHVRFVAAEGSLKLAYGGQWPTGAGQLPKPDVVVRRAGSSDRVATFSMGSGRDASGVPLLAGRYDVEVLTVPPTTLRGVEVRGAAASDLTLPMPGLLILVKPKGITTGAIFRLRNGKVELASTLNPSAASERLFLQPGQYELAVHPQGSTLYNKVETRRFVIESGQTTKVEVDGKY